MRDSNHHDVVGAVFNELDWAIAVDAQAIGVQLDEGVVTLTGGVADEHGRTAALAAAFRVIGVRTIDDQLSTGGPAIGDPANTDIARRVERALATAGISRHQMRAEVRDHIVTLSGRVDWSYEREAARRLLESLVGVRRVINRLDLVRRPSPDITTGLIHEELARGPLFDSAADVIHVSILDCEVTLTGIVQSDTQSQRAEHAAWASPHVSVVHNELIVRPL